MSRTGRREELLRGPTLYGLVFCAVTFFWWRRLDGATALLALCVGDGVAEPAGRRWGGGPGLPWNPRKSWAGTAAFLASALAASALAAARFHALGWSDAPWRDALPALARACVVGALAESLPLVDVDNAVVPIAVLVAMR